MRNGCGSAITCGLDAEIELIQQGTQPAEMGAAMTVTDSIRGMLDSLGIPYRYLEHAPTRTSAESAAARGEPLEIGAKALLVKVGDEFKLFVLSAARKLDSDAVKRQFGVKKIRFAGVEELAQLTGLVPGSVPPFGRPILPFDLAVDEGIQQLERVAFNAGSLTASIVMGRADYLRAAQPGLVFAFSE